ncbi:MAG: hypothetical protein JSS02_15440 [Planctomycetes bacterium]|nr:hypothetical protein [Planctomycetota bacterium]
MDEADPNRVRCPTCRAQQVWSDTCRRCKSDLRLLRAADQTYRRHQYQCLEALRAGQSALALVEARACQELVPDAASRKLVAVCALLAGDCATAHSLAAGYDPLHSS